MPRDDRTFQPDVTTEREMRYKATPMAARTVQLPAAYHASQPSPLATVIATLLIVLLPLGVMVPAMLVRATTASLDAVPSLTAPGGVVSVVGTDFPPGQRGSLILDDGSVLGTFKATRTGAISVLAIIPTSTTVGDRVLRAVAVSSGRYARESGVAVVLATTRVSVQVPISSPGVPLPPSSTPNPPPNPTPTPHVHPTPGPVSTPQVHPTQSPTPTPHVHPTPGPVPTPQVHITPGPTPASEAGPTFVESQAWWVQTPGMNGTDFGHLHVGAWIPYKRVVSGVLELQLRFVMHDNPGEFVYFNPVLKTDTQEISLPHDTRLTGWTCEGTCTQLVTTSIDTTLSEFDGIQEIRIRAYVDQPDGNRMHASVNALVDLRNGNPVNPIDRRPYQRFKGWYTGSGYCEAGILSDLPAWPAVTLQAVHHGAADDLPVSRYIVTVDADVHAGIPGTVIARGDGELPPTSFDLSSLAPGEHRLAIRAECDDPSGSTNVGVGVTTFTVP